MIMKNVNSKLIPEVHERIKSEMFHIVTYTEYNLIWSYITKWLHCSPNSKIITTLYTIQNVTGIILYSDMIQVNCLQHIYVQKFINLILIKLTPVTKDK